MICRRIEKYLSENDDSPCYESRSYAMRDTHALGNFSTRQALEVGECNSFARSRRQLAKGRFQTANIFLLDEPLIRVGLFCCAAQDVEIGKSFHWDDLLSPNSINQKIPRANEQEVSRILGNPLLSGFEHSHIDFLPEVSDVTRIPPILLQVPHQIGFERYDFADKPSRDSIIRHGRTFTCLAAETVPCCRSLTHRFREVLASAKRLSIAF